ncbi:MAG: hypothetical protein M3327_03990 [Actinomycetota bacterium]|nr:hypothetical protein [Actinomycetota bacterium]
MFRLCGRPRAPPREAPGSLGVADALDSILTHRVYSNPRQPDDAVAEVRRNTDEQFCFRCIDALEQLIARERVGVVAPQAAVAQIPELRVPGIVDPKGREAA